MPQLAVQCGLKRTKQGFGKLAATCTQHSHLPEESRAEGTAPWLARSQCFSEALNTTCKEACDMLQSPSCARDWAMNLKGSLGCAWVADLVRFVRYLPI
jgi:hypothetical protein